ncbi:MAG: hypothetical protein OXO52_07685 [Rhodospirillales bacterium]|nr:hypothetical protein [Rhodospirillales bacterium]
MERRDGLEPHRLVAHRVEHRETGGQFRRLDPGGRRDDLVRLPPASFEPCRVVRQQVNRPGDRVGRGVLSGEQQGPGVGEDFGIGEFADVGRRHDRLQKVPRHIPPAGLGVEARPRHGHHGGDFLPQCGERAVGRETDQAPVAPRRVHPPVQHREHRVEMALDRRTPGLQRVGIEPERELHRRVDGEAHQVAAQIDRLARIRRPFPAPPKTLHRGPEPGKEVLDPGAPERGGDDPALAPPVLALGGEHPLEPHPLGRRLQRAGAAEPVRALDQDALDRSPIGQHRDATRPDADAVQRAVAPGPALQRRMQRVETNAVQVADQRPPRRAGKVAEMRGSPRVASHEAVFLSGRRSFLPGFSNRARFPAAANAVTCAGVSNSRSGGGGTG